MLRSMKLDMNKVDWQKKYRETPRGVLTRIYASMRTRRGVEFTLQEFHDRYLNDKKYLRLYSEWVKSGKDKWKKPSIDRISNKRGYTTENTQMMTWGENRYKQTMERRARKGAIIKLYNGQEIERYRSQRDAVIKLGISSGNLSECIHGKRKHCAGYEWRYATVDNTQMEETNG